MVKVKATASVAPVTLVRTGGVRRASPKRTGAVVTMAKPTWMRIAFREMKISWPVRKIVFPRESRRGLLAAKVSQLVRWARLRVFHVATRVARAPVMMIC